PQPKKQSTRKPKEKAPMQAPALKQEFNPEISQSPQPIQAYSGGPLALNTRLDPIISSALLRASMERKIQRVTPFTQRDIVTEALAEWLKHKGFLPR
ncbi:MAG: hypothetical protein WCF18_09840, partial [Chthoniobacteraceae bacterium]